MVEQVHFRLNPSVCVCVCVRDKGRETGVEKKREIEAGDRVMNPNAQPLAPAHQLCLNAVILLTESRRVVCERMHALERERERVCVREGARETERERAHNWASQPICTKKQRDLE